MVVTVPTKESVPKRVTPVGAWSSEQMTPKGSSATQTTKVTSCYTDYQSYKQINAIKLWWSQLQPRGQSQRE